MRLSALQNLEADRAIQRLGHAIYLQVAKRLDLAGMNSGSRKYQTPMSPRWILSSFSEYWVTKTFQLAPGSITRARTCSAKARAASRVRVLGVFEGPPAVVR